MRNDNCDSKKLLLSITRKRQIIKKRPEEEKEEYNKCTNPFKIS